MPKAPRRGTRSAAAVLFAGQLWGAEPHFIRASPQYATRASQLLAGGGKFTASRLSRPLESVRHRTESARRNISHSGRSLAMARFSSEPFPGFRWKLDLCRIWANGAGRRGVQPQFVNGMRFAKQTNGLRLLSTGEMTTNVPPICFMVLTAKTCRYDFTMRLVTHLYPAHCLWVWGLGVFTTF